MRGKAEALVSRMRAVNEEVIRVAESCSVEDWRVPVIDQDGRPVGVVFHHIATAYDAITDWAGNLALEKEPMQMTMEQIHVYNAQHAREHARTSRAETVDYLRQVTEDTAARLLAFDDDQLSRSTPLDLAGGREFSAEVLIRRFCIEHAEGHLATIQDTLQGVKADVVDR